jgi:hypothetical protein
MGYYLVIQTENHSNQGDCGTHASNVRTEIANRGYVRKDTVRIHRFKCEPRCTISIFFETEPPRTKANGNWPQIIENSYRLKQGVRLTVLYSEKTYRHGKFAKLLVDGTF